VVYIYNPSTNEAKAGVQGLGYISNTLSKKKKKERKKEKRRKEGASKKKEGRKKERKERICN
jgi:hypothetical protein